jgi:hypothetical protein
MKKYHFSITKFEYDEAHQAHAIHFKMNTYVNDEMHEECEAYTNQQAAINWLNSNRLSWFQFMYEDWIIQAVNHFCPGVDPYRLFNSDVFGQPREEYLAKLHKTHCQFLHEITLLKNSTPLLKLHKCLTLFIENEPIIATFIKNLPPESLLCENMKYLFNWAHKVLKENRVPNLEAA